MDNRELIENYPLLYHMAEKGTWQSIKNNGLRSTSALLDLFEVEAATRFQIESCHRPKSVTITHPIHGTAVIRDQKPMSDKGLIRALVGTGLKPADWYRLLNRRVFFWLCKERLDTLLTAELYRDKTQLVLTVDTARLLSRHSNIVELSPINTGCTIPFPHPRGQDTFCKIAQFPFVDRRKTRRLSGAVAELTTLDQVSDIADYVTRVEHWKGGFLIERVD